MSYLAEVTQAIRNLLVDHFDGRVPVEIVESKDRRIIPWTPGPDGPPVRVIVEWDPEHKNPRMTQATPEEWDRQRMEAGEIDQATSPLDSPPRSAWLDRAAAPRHTVAEVARYTGLTQSTIRRWPKLAGRTAPIRASHLDLMELAVVAALSRAGMTWGAIRVSHSYLANEFTTTHPFADERMNILPILGFADPGCLADTLACFDYSNGLAVRWYPRGRGNPVVIDARCGFGSPTVDGVNTWAMAGAARAGESVEFVADDYDLTVEEVRAALEFEEAEVGS